MPARSVREEMNIERSVIRKRRDGLGSVYDFLGSLWESERFKDRQGKILWGLALIYVMIDPGHGKRVSVPAPMVKDDGNTQDFPANPREVEVYASIDANEIYSSFWAAVKTYQDKKI